MFVCFNVINDRFDILDKILVVIDSFDFIFFGKFICEGFFVIIILELKFNFVKNIFI